MPKMMPNPSACVNIVGAGIAGLTLGRCFQAKGIPYNLFDKGPPSSHRYGLTITPNIFQDLFRYIGEDLHTEFFRRRTAVDRILPSGRGVEFDEDIDAGRTSVFRAEDQVLRGFLAGNQVIHRDGYDVVDASNSEIGVKLHFSNGTVNIAPITVDAGGANSGLRKILFPHVHPEVLPWVVYHGKRQLTEKDYQEYAIEFGRGNCIFVAPSQSGDWAIAVNKTYIAPTFSGDDQSGALGIDESPTQHEESFVELQYTVSRRRTLEPDTLFRPGRKMEEATTIPERFYKEMKGLRSSTDSALVKFILEPIKLREDGILNWLMRSHVIEREDADLLSKRGVVMTGDTEGAVPILYPLGANHAVRDSLKLAYQLNPLDIKLEPRTRTRDETLHERLLDSRNFLNQYHFPLVDVLARHSSIQLDPWYEKTPRARRLSFFRLKNSEKLETVGKPTSGMTKRAPAKHPQDLIREISAEPRSRSREATERDLSAVLRGENPILPRSERVRPRDESELPQKSRTGWDPPEPIWR